MRLKDKVAVITGAAGNAGIEGPNAPIGEFPEDAFDRVMQVNVRGVFLGMKYVPPHMNDAGSVII